MVMHHCAILCAQDGRPCSASSERLTGPSGRRDPRLPALPARPGRRRERGGRPVHAADGRPDRPPVPPAVALLCGRHEHPAPRGARPLDRRRRHRRGRGLRHHRAPRPQPGHRLRLHHRPQHRARRLRPRRQPGRRGRLERGHRHDLQPVPAVHPVELARNPRRRDDRRPHEQRRRRGRRRGRNRGCSWPAPSATAAAGRPTSSTR